MSPTPILDGEQPLPSRKVHWVPALFLGFVIGGLRIAFERATGSGPIHLRPTAIAEFFAALYIAILVHETGHAIAGITAGFELRAFMVGAFLFSKEAGRWRFRLLLRNLLWGGFTAATPCSDQDLLNRYMRFVLGGPAASLILLVLTLLFPVGPLIRILFWVNLLLTVSVCIPYTVVSLPNDAKLILLLTGKGAVAERIVASLYLLALDTQGKRPRDLPRALIEKLSVATKDTSRMPTALSFLLSDAAENNDPQQGAEILEQALAMNHKMLPDARRGFMAAAACYHGFHNRDAARTEEWLKRARSVKSNASQRDWDSQALATTAFARGDYDQATELLTRFIALIDRQPTSGMLAAERERMLALVNSLSDPSTAQLFTTSSNAVSRALAQ